MMSVFHFYFNAFSAVICTFCTTIILNYGKCKSICHSICNVDKRGGIFRPGLDPFQSWFRSGLLTINIKHYIFKYTLKKYV